MCQGYERYAPMQGLHMVAQLKAGTCERPPTREGKINRDQTDTCLGGHCPYVQGRHGGGCSTSTDPPQGQFVGPDCNKGDIHPALVYNACRGTGLAANFACNSSVHWEIQKGYL